MLPLKNTSQENFSKTTDTFSKHALFFSGPTGPTNTEEVKRKATQDLASLLDNDILLRNSSSWMDKVERHVSHGANLGYKKTNRSPTLQEKLESFKFYSKRQAQKGRERCLIYDEYYKDPLSDFIEPNVPVDKAFVSDILKLYTLLNPKKEPEPAIATQTTSLLNNQFSPKKRYSWRDKCVTSKARIRKYSKDTKDTIVLRDPR